MHSSALPAVFAQPQYAIGAEYACGHVGGAPGIHAVGNAQLSNEFVVIPPEYFHRVESYWWNHELVELFWWNQAVILTTKGCYQ